SARRAACSEAGEKSTATAIRAKLMPPPDAPSLPVSSRSTGRFSRNGCAAPPPRRNPCAVSRRFDDSYREELTLRDGSHATVRLLRPGDRDLLADGFRRLSERARYQRFFVPKATLTAPELDYLTRIDQESHVALAAVAEAADGEVGLGV